MTCAQYNKFGGGEKKITVQKNLLMGGKNKNKKKRAESVLGSPDVGHGMLVSVLILKSILINQAFIIHYRAALGSDCLGAQLASQWCVRIIIVLGPAGMRIFTCSGSLYQLPLSCTLSFSAPERFHWSAQLHTSSFQKALFACSKTTSITNKNNNDNNKEYACVLGRVFIGKIEVGKPCLFIKDETATGKMCAVPYSMCLEKSRLENLTRGIY